MLTWILVTCLVGLMTSISASDANQVHRQKRQVGGIGEIGLRCTDGTVVRTPYIYTSKTLDVVISELPDPKDATYLNECKRWLGSDHKSDHVFDVDISDVFPIKNGTRYRATLCCKDKLSKKRCFKCTNELDPYTCNYQNDLIDCADGEQCGITYTCPANKNGYANITKGCIPAGTQCNRTGASKCSVRRPGEICTKCCDDSFCNENATRRYCYPDTPRPNYIFPCNAKPCKNGGMCKTLALVSKANYSCCCMPGYYGRNCSMAYSTDCLTNDCQNGGTCVKIQNGTSVCNCSAGYIGDYCEKPVAMKCFDSDLLYERTHTWQGYNCSQINKYTFPRTSYVSNCRYYVRTKYGLKSYFKDGDDGYVKELQSISLAHCYGGEACAYYKVQMCCPSCHMKPCQNDGYCIQTDDGTGDFVCRCRFGYSGKTCQNVVNTCMVFGEPHFKSFDQKMINFQGQCKYTLSQSLTTSDPSLRQFAVRIQNEERDGLNGVTFPKYIEIAVGGYTVKLDKNNAVFSKQGSGAYQQIFPTVVFPGFKITMNGRFVRLETDFGLVVEYEGDFVALVQVPAQYANSLGGICNDMDGKGDNDDLIDCNGVQQADTPVGHARYGDSCLVPSPENANKQCKTIDPPSCSAAKEQLYSGSNWCGYMNDTNGPFSMCIHSGKINTANYFSSCVYDTCRSESLKCPSFWALATACFKVGTSPASGWRATVGCPMKCPDNSKYVERGSACQPTCDKINAPDTCAQPATEVCACDTGLIFKKGVCVDPSKCGCKDGKNRYEIGDSWGYEEHQDGSCTQKSCEVCTSCSLKVGQVKKSTVTCKLETTTAVTTPSPCDSFDPDYICNDCDNINNPCPIYFGHPCNRTIFYMCSPSLLGDSVANMKSCASCTVWDNNLLTCVHDANVNCQSNGVPDTSIDDNMCAQGANILRAVPGEPTKYWQGTHKMSCAFGTKFDISICNCNVDLTGQNNAGTTDSGLVAHISFDDKHNLLASAIYVSSVGEVTRTTGVVKDAARLNGKSALKVEYFKSWEGSELSISLWYKRTGTRTGSMPILSNEYPPSIILESESTTTLGGGIITRGPTIGQSNGISGVSAKSNEWHHVVLVYDSSDVKLYLDGQLKKSLKAEGHVEARQSPLYIGMDSQGSGFVGLIDEIYFYTKALAQDDVSALYKKKSN